MNLFTVLAERERIIQIQEIFDLQVLDFSFYNLRLHRISVKVA